uniref:Adenylyl-sulfate reductase n=1 Tax=Candidatus Kentrum sp. FM TaxID=2126340 RepID=A0A450TEJ0_9GAMM|nr:MAG: hypothetical protein BECKFM1743C_GA0114222_100294 [Candidatus Kentron sp. FM]VFJ65530.1 MAG: hypothetical protein BECKFM1743A_GA0114220_103842 [Candidatus Kentron sp. FM]VFK16014.1 MAG: hypothetical protein BECKFM1743B_GA0114221_103982 [Candidatus Kentron sp. FM]
MFATNPFHDLYGVISPMAMQIYVVAMFLMVIGGTILDVIHKKSAKYFFENAKKAQESAKRSVSGGEKVSLVLKTVANEVLTSAEFDSTKRRISHLFTMYGFILFVVMTVVLIFAYPVPATPMPAIVPQLWHLGALMLCFGGYWFWFSIRADVSAEGNPWYRLVRADLFIVSLLATATFALIWSAAQAGGVSGWDTLFFALFIIAATVLFSTVLWSKFAHMFFKPSAAYQKKITKVDGSQENLPDLGDLTDPVLQARYPDIPEYMGANPSYMGLGIKRESSNHY